MQREIGVLGRDRLGNPGAPEAEPAVAHQHLEVELRVPAQDGLDRLVQVDRPVGPALDVEVRAVEPERAVPGPFEQDLPQVPVPVRLRGDDHAVALRVDEHEIRDPGRPNPRELDRGQLKSPGASARFARARSQRRTGGVPSTHGKAAARTRGRSTRTAPKTRQRRRFGTEKFTMLHGLPPNEATLDDSRRAADPHPSAS